MSDAIKHECGIALVRLKKPLEFYLEKYGTAFYGLSKLHLLMEKQSNRGQDGAGGHSRHKPALTLTLGAIQGGHFSLGGRVDFLT